MHASLGRARSPAGRGRTPTNVDAYATGRSAAGPRPRPPPTSAWRFRILRPHARGGLGEVFVAHDGGAGPRGRPQGDPGPPRRRPGQPERFLLEAEITGGLEHPGIVPVYGLGTYADGRPFYAMRFIRGDSLQDAIERFHAADAPGRDPGERALAAAASCCGRFIDVCNAVAYAHSRGVLHRDLKPGNVMLGKYGETLVVDWGLAKPLGGRTPDTGRGGRGAAPAASGGESAADA